MRLRTKPPIRPLLAVTALSLGLAACSGAASGSGATGTSAPTTTAPGTASARVACASVSPAQIRATTGTTVGAPQVTVHGSVATCTYPAADAGQPIVLQYASGANATLFASDQARVASAHGPTTPVTGLGDQAYYFTTPAGSRTATTLIVLTGSLQFIVTSTSSLSQVEGLAQLVLYAVDAARSTTTTTTTDDDGRRLTCATTRTPAPPSRSAGPGRVSSGPVRARRASGQPPEMSWTFCLPAVTKGIMARSSAPTCSIWCSWPAFLSAS